MSMKSWMLGAAIAAMTVVGVTAQAEGRTVSKGVAKSLQAAQAASKSKKMGRVHLAVAHRRRCGRQDRL